MDMAKIIKPWKLDAQPTYIFTNAKLVDPVQAQVTDNVTIKTVGGKIVSVDTNSSTSLTTAEGEIVVDLNGKHICPGLIDCHVHIAVVPGEANLSAYQSMTERISLIRQPWVLKPMIERGFTSVRDCGGATLAMKEAVEEGICVGPRLFIAGYALSQTGGHGDMRSSHDQSPCSCGAVSGISRIVDGPSECFRVARDELRQGADFIKIMGGGGIASATDKAIVTAAKNNGTYVTSHSYTPQAIQQAIRQGVRGIEHGNLIDEETAKLMAEAGTFLTPTLITHVMSKQLNFLPPISAAKNDEVLQKGLHAIKIATDAGVTVCFGTDLLGPLHFAQSKEFSVRSQVQTPAEILRSATVNAAKLLMRENELGQIKEGYAADFIVLNANPLEDITILDRAAENILAVVKDGRVLTSKLDDVKVDVQSRP
ncbi:imidazole proprionase-related amidohydrolase [Trichoderma guizhouense]|uniref:Imidazole proprionase-related amidohydrolase n=1 Tax=Trichoderma guizhouense TaxID=1491466 RepID=A0A1T3CDI0_9HYPO|nr:imidazole proprionase-related amidohydrolase [Trichoderma guizhouense]